MAVPPPAAAILELIRVTETSRRDATAYETIFSHAEAKLTKSITQMTIDEVQHWQPGFTKSFGSSATGAYQFMFSTLRDLKSKLALTGEEIFDAAMQDRLGHELLLRRGYQPWIDGKTSTDTFMISLAKEWASFPVPSRMKGAHRIVERGQSWYAGDGLNKALAKPDVVWLALEAARKATGLSEPEPIKPPKPEEPVEPVGEESELSREEWLLALEKIGKALANPAVRDALIAAMAKPSIMTPATHDEA